MKKGVLIAIGLLFLCSLVTACYGDDVNVADTRYSVNLRNNTGSHADFLIPTTTIRPGIDKLTGYDCFTIVESGGNTETWISIFDATDSLMTGECFGEQESSDINSIHDRWVRGLKIFNGIAVRLGAFTEAQIYFRRK